VEDSHKHAYKNEEFKLENDLWFFPKIKEAFKVKLKIIFVDHYFHHQQTPKNVEIIFQKTFYTETNGR
jgi:hypothetical protein